jgi:hypothetical protein
VAPQAAGTGSPVGVACAVSITFLAMASPVRRRAPAPKWRHCLEIFAEAVFVPVLTATTGVRTVAATVGTGGGSEVTDAGYASRRGALAAGYRIPAIKLVFVSFTLSGQRRRYYHLKPLKNREQNCHTGSWPSIAAGNRDCSAVAFNEIPDKRESDSQT